MRHICEHFSCSQSTHFNKAATFCQSVLITMVLEVSNHNGTSKDVHTREPCLISDLPLNMTVS